jgi:hypothetical protein
VIALTLVQRETEDEVAGRIMGGVQMLFRLGLGAGALGMGAIAHSVDSLDLGVIRLDGNQVGLIVGGRPDHPGRIRSNRRDARVRVERAGQ